MHSLVFFWFLQTCHLKSLHLSLSEHEQSNSCLESDALCKWSILCLSAGERSSDSLSRVVHDRVSSSRVHPQRQRWEEIGQSHATKTPSRALGSCGCSSSISNVASHPWTIENPATTPFVGVDCTRLQLRIFPLTFCIRPCCDCLDLRKTNN